MNFNVKIKNLGKLANNEIDISNFIVLAGPNNSGKSFVSKALYSIIKALRTNHAKAYLTEMFSKIGREIHFIALPEAYINKESLEHELNEKFNSLISIVQKCPSRDLKELDETVQKIIDQMDEVHATIEKIFQIKTANRTRQLNTHKGAGVDIYKTSCELVQILRNLSAREIVDGGIGVEINKKIKDNFQISSVSQLANFAELPIEIDIENVGNFKITDKGTDLNLNESWREYVLPFSRLIYIESPIYWKLKMALDDIRDRFGDSWELRKPIVGIPEYYYDLARDLQFEYTGDIAFPDLYSKLTSNSVIGGKLAISEEGNQSFQENGRNHSVMQTATGVANLGFLCLLIERKLLDENSIVFIDEPEAHLHPAWQVILAESLFELSRAGVHVVVATHSVDILKWLEVHVKKNPSDIDLIALNDLSISSADSDYDFNDRITAIKSKLTQPFADLYIQGQ